MGDILIRVAIVDDDQSCINKLKELILLYGKENGEEFRIATFTNGVNFISEYTAEYDLVLMDIDMPHLSGMETAKLLRKVDSRVALIFVTNLALYAVMGYEVEAMDFIIKPVEQKIFFSKLKRILPRIKTEDVPFLMVNTKLGIARVYITDIYYISVKGRYVVLHTRNGDVDMHISMKEIEKKLSGYNFVRGDNSSMVNLMYVSAVTNEGAIVNGELVPASRNRKKALMDAFTLYLR